MQIHLNHNSILVDEDIFDRIRDLPLRIDTEGYVRVTFKENGKPREQRLHRFVMGLPAGSGKYDRSIVIDHVNGLKTDCTRSNLRLISHSENCRNRSTTTEIKAFGRTRSLIEWSESDECTVGYETLKSRINNGWTAEAAMTAPRYSRRR